MAFPKFQTKEVLNKVLNTGEDALKVDLSDSVTVDSEFPAAAAITDNFANPTTTSAMSMLMGWDTSTWDRVQIGDGTAASALRVTISTNDSHFGAVGAAADVDGVIHGQLRYIGTGVDTVETSANAIQTAVEKIDNSIFADNAGFTLTTSSVNVAGGVYQSGTPGTLGDNDAGAVLLNSTSGQMVELMASTATTEVVGDAAEDAAAAGNPVLSGGRYDSPGNDNATVRSLDDNDVGALALDPTGALYVREYLGQTGSCFVSGTAAVTAAIGKFVAIQFLEDTVFNGTDGLVATDLGRWPDDSGAATDISSSNTAAVGSQVFPQGMTIFGRWDSFILVSGAVIAYVGNV